MHQYVKVLVCPAGSISMSTTNGRVDKAIQDFKNSGTIFLVPDTQEHQITIIRL